MDTLLDKEMGTLFQNGYLIGRWIFEWSCRRLYQDCPQVYDYTGDFVNVVFIDSRRNNNMSEYLIKTDCCDIATDYLSVFKLKISSGKNEEAEKISFEYLYDEH